MIYAGHPYCQGSEIASRKLIMDGHVAGVEASKKCTQKCRLLLITGTLEDEEINARIILKHSLGKYITVV
jgi:hypothetical protein